MPFQKQVTKEPSEGFPGGWGSANIYYASAAIAGEDVVVGRMCRIDGATPAADSLNPDRAYMGGAGAIGIALRVRIGVITDLTAESSNTINTALPVELLLEGDCNVYLSTGGATAARGMKIFYRQTNSAAAGAQSTAGELRAAAAGSTVAGFVESKWSVYKVLDAGTGLVKVSTYRNA